MGTGASLKLSFQDFYSLFSCSGGHCLSLIVKGKPASIAVHLFVDVGQIGCCFGYGEVLTL